MYIGLRVLHPCPFLMKPDFYRQISKNPQILNFMKIRAVGAELFHAHGQTDGQI